MLYGFLFGIWFGMVCEICMPTVVRIHKQNENLIMHGHSARTKWDSHFVWKKIIPNEISFGTSFGIECHGFLQNHIRNDDLVCDLVHCKRWPKIL